MNNNNGKQAMTLDKLAALVQEEFLTFREEMNNKFKEVDDKFAKIITVQNEHSNILADHSKVLTDHTSRLARIEHHQEVFLQYLDNHDRRISRLEKKRS